MHSYQSPDAEPIIALSVNWFQRRDDVLALALVGSYARGAARPDSDIDLVILCTTPQAYRTSLRWPAELPWARIGLALSSMHDQDYGMLWSRHVRLSSGLEIEYGFAAEQWASLNPLDPGTYQVMRAGHRILFDRSGLLRALSQYVLAHQAA